MSDNVREVQILLVEDNPADAELTQLSLREAKVANQLTVVETVDEAIDHLNAPDLPPADLILLDLNLPGRPGGELLDYVKSSPDLEKTPVVVLTSSSARKDIIESYAHKANAYVTKPVTLEGFSEIMRTIDDFWLVAVRLPGQAEGSTTATANA